MRREAGFAGLEGSGLTRSGLTRSRRNGWRLVVTLAALGWVAAPGSASAFCRSTTCTGECERDADECKTSGAKLSWRTSCVGYSLQRDGTANLPMKHVRPAIERSFAKWVDLECEDGIATLSFSELDDVSCHQTEYNDGEANANIVLFQDTKWKYTSADNNLAKTTVTFDDETGEILDADIEVNHAYNFFTISDENVEYDLESVVTHEVGHFIGLDHTLDPSATMNATYERGTTDLRTIEIDDVDGACAVYPPDRDAKCNTKPKGGLRDDCGQVAAAKDDPAAEADEGGCGVKPVGGARSAVLAALSLFAAGVVGARRRARQVPPEGGRGESVG